MIEKEFIFLVFYKIFAHTQCYVKRIIEDISDLLHESLGREKHSMRKKIIELKMIYGSLIKEYGYISKAMNWSHILYYLLLTISKK